jgi:Protein of unknown function (DUF2852)
MDIVGRLDEIGKPAWISLMVLGFIVYWPVGLALLVFIIWSGRMKCWKHGRAGRWYNGDAKRHGGPSSGNRAFDEYRAETLRRLEEEQRDFVEFLERLRFAKDKAEFDQFLAERRRAAGPEPQSPG